MLNNHIAAYFRYTLIEPPDQTWGRPGPNNTFNGMIGQLQREVMKSFLYCCSQTIHLLSIIILNIFLSDSY